MPKVTTSSSLVMFQLYLEGVRARQHRDRLFMEKLTMEKAIQLANGAVDCHNTKVLRIEDQVC